jgi:hypothetical protein
MFFIKKSKEKNRKYLVSGIAPSNTGVGRLMKRIVPIAEHFKFSIIHRRDQKSVMSMIINYNLFFIIYELTSRFISRIIFYSRVFFINNSTVLFLHPQTVGFDLLIRLIKNNTVYLYVMDNSFFCIRSYNNNPVTNAECLICISKPINVLSQCTPFPVNYKKSKNLEQLEDLKKISDKVFFLAQNEKQKELLYMHFGSRIRCSIVGLDTGEFELTSEDRKFRKLNDISYDLVFHGSAHLAKGLAYFVDISTLLPEYSCFLPSSQSTVEKILGKRVIAKNIVFSECTWETGLKEIVMSAKLVVNPSLWSAPIEGALLKSLAVNGNVAIVETKFGFSEEIFADCKILRLSFDVKSAVKEIKNYFVSGKYTSEKSKKWLDSFLKINSVENIFHQISKEN